MQTRFKKSLLASTIFVGAAAFASPAFAQIAEPAEAAPAEESSTGDIVVTGTLIRNPNLEASSPVSVIGSDEVELQQANVAEELLRELPGAVPSIGSAVNNGNGGSSYVNLRGLGSNRNVVLVDGVRLAPADLIGRFDLNNIPLALVERTEVLTGGASTTYGADAIGGVVNFITRQDFSGVEIAASEQITEEGDGNIFRVDVTVGANFDDGRGNAVFSVGYQEADAVYQGARDFSNLQFDSFTGGGSGSGTSVPSRFSVPGQGTRQVNPDTGSFFPGTTFTPFNFNPYNIFQTPFERFNMYGAAHYEISDAIEVYTRGIYSKNTVSTIIAPSGAFGIAVAIPISNPFLPVGVRNTYCSAFATSTLDLNPTQPGVQGLNPGNCAAAAAATGPSDPNYRQITVNLSRRAVEVGPRISDYTTQYFDYRAGARGGITDSIDWDIWGSYGESDKLQVIRGYTLNSRVRQSLLTTGQGAAATCQDTSNGCVPIDWFGAANNANFGPAAVDFLNENSTVQIVTTQAQARGTISGDFGWTIPWAAEPVSFAVGGEYRRYTALQASDSLSQGGDLGGAGGAAPNIDGGYDVYEAIGELIVPIVADTPFFEELTLEAGIRYSHYKVDAPGNPTYNTTTYKVGGSWEPGWGLKFRGNYARAVRAPNINELFSPQNTVLTNLSNDPCASIDDNGNVIAPAPTGVLRDVCIAQGAPASSIGLIPVPTAGQANVTTGGNLGLKPEKADTYTIGAVFTPDFLSGFSASLDYFNIKVKGAVSTPTPGDSLAACFGAPSTSNPACLVIGRDPLTGGLSGDPATTSGLFAALTNLGELDNSGFDLTLNYRTDLGSFAKLSLGFVGTYNIDSKFNADATSASTFDRECVGYFSVNCLTIQPEFQWSQRTTLTFDDVDVSLLWRHIDDIYQEPIDACTQNVPGTNAPDPACSGPFFNGTLPASAGAGFAGRQENFGKNDAADYFDLTTRYQINDNFSLTLSVQNMLDRKPPLNGNTAGSTTYNSGNTYPSTYDALGRRFAASVRLRF